MMKHPSSRTALACLMLAGLFTHAHAAQLVTWTFSGTLGEIGKGYAYDDYRQQLNQQVIAEGGTPATYYPMYTADQRAAVDKYMAPFATGQQFTATVTVDLDTPYGPDGVASFPAAIKMYQLAIPDASVNAANGNAVHQGISITQDSASGGDLYYFYLPHGGYDWMYDPSHTTVFGGTVYAIAPQGNQNLSPNLHDFANTFDPSKFTALLGGASVNNGECGISGCGSLGFNIQAASVSSVPETSSLLMMNLGLAGLGLGVHRRKR